MRSASRSFISRGRIQATHQTHMPPEIHPPYLLPHLPPHLRPFAFLSFLLFGHLLLHACTRARHLPLRCPSAGPPPAHRDNARRLGHGARDCDTPSIVNYQPIIAGNCLIALESKSKPLAPPSDASPARNNYVTYTACRLHEEYHPPPPFGRPSLSYVILLFILRLRTNIEN
jgi:hypothetical protein